MKLIVLAAALLASTLAGAQPKTPARNVVIVTTDGLRWQELFRGADTTLLTPDRYYDKRSVDALKQQFLAPTEETRRMRLMPFVWGTLAKHGVLWGDRDLGSDASVTNGFNFSYPGYSEILTGHPDPRIHSNDNIPNPNVTVLEWLNRQPGLEHTAAAFGAWAVINGIVDKDRCGFPVNAGYDAFTMDPMTPRLLLLNQQKADAPRVWDDEPFDAPAFATAMEYIEHKRPRVLFISLGETDDWAHMGNYGEYLLSAHRADRYLQQLWTRLQSMKQYRGTTALVFATDHGRGNDADEGWRGHGQKQPESKYIFIGLMGAGIPAAGLQANTAPVTQNQIAATAARLLGKNWNAAEPRAGKPLPLLLSLPLPSPLSK